MNRLSPLCIIQARIHSSRLPDKMLQLVGGYALVWWAWKAAVEDFGSHNVVIACPADDVAALHHACPQALIFGWTGNEDDVLGRLTACAEEHRQYAEQIVIRVTPDDFPIDTHRERCTLGQLREWNRTVTDAETRQHIGYLWASRVEVNTAADLEEVRRRVQPD